MQVQQKEEKMEAGCFMKKNAGWAAENTLLCCLEPFWCQKNDPYPNAIYFL